METHILHTFSLPVLLKYNKFQLNKIAWQHTYFKDSPSTRKILNHSNKGFL